MTDEMALRYAEFDAALFEIIQDLEKTWDLSDEDRLLALIFLRMAFVVGYEHCYNEVVDSLPKNPRYLET